MERNCNIRVGEIPISENLVSNYLDEAQLEIAVVDYFRELGYEYVHSQRCAVHKRKRHQQLRR